MSLYVESGIEFDFSSAKTLIEHDKTSPTYPVGRVSGSAIWPGVDFLIEEASGEWIWLEVKSWNPSRIDPERRGGSRRSFICKMKSAKFSLEMREKFLGTTAFLAWKNEFTPATTRFILLFEPPKPLDSALLGSQNLKMRGLIPNRRDWVKPIYASVMTLREWNLRFRDYPSKVI